MPASGRSRRCRNSAGRSCPGWRPTWRGSPSPPESAIGGTAVVGGSGALAGGMNALVSTDYVANQHQVFIHLMTLLRFDEELRPEPWLARSWDPGCGRNRGGLPPPGRRALARRNPHHRPRRGLHLPPGHGSPHRIPQRRLLDPLPSRRGGVEVVDDHTVRFRMRPHADALDPWRSTSILPVHLLGDVPPETLREHPFGTRCPVGNGPFVFVDHGADGSWTFRGIPTSPGPWGGLPIWSGTSTGPSRSRPPS
jgi:ABC-type transport system substrate-binding protein